MSQPSGTPTGIALLAVLISFPIGFIFFPIGFLLGLIFPRAFALYIFSVPVASLAIVLHDLRLVEEHSHELVSGGVGFIIVVLINLIATIPSPKFSTYPQVIEQNLLAYFSVLYLIGIVIAIFYNRNYDD